MAYLKYKEVTKYFNFSEFISVEDLPAYVKEYVFDGEEILCGYKTSKDYGIFTTKKIVLFDKESSMGLYKQIFTIPYSSISTLSIIYKVTGAEFSLFLNSGYPLRLKFVNMKNPNKDLPNIEKKRLRLVYSIISKIINNQEVTNEEINVIKENRITFVD